MTGVETVDERARTGGASLFVYLALGVLFGITLVKSEAVSWFRIQEMFRFQAFHMYGIMGSALVVAALSVALIKRFHIRTLDGEPIVIPPKELGRGHGSWIGGAMFGVGWALTGACPGPLFALVGAGVTVVSVAVVSAVAGTWLYGYVRPVLPH